ncbi:response regulator [Candidatus Galacturonibacter soehngenii]|uniref:Stage 0 sporulation protein A homolog n=1 Tax=Candidatus Galacturonatibacter soehngenii TaxID=2307010 RepID=A0A7V7UDD4_9FIRM|nr:response regulator [Candidatus Galacturonibacter soehngenii]KAB1440416.1 response regulator [Candidatus Galacturonibacter soehngenii]MBA4688938.1 response regulator [Candidatus Galacturonibacter soehngenii]
MQEHILVIDDMLTNLKIVESFLKPYYKVSLVKSGEQALKFMEKNRPDLILLDIQMPGMDGFETIQRLKENPDDRNIPVLFLTSQEDIDSRMRGFQLGATDFILKPFMPEMVLKVIAARLKKKEEKV